MDIRDKVDFVYDLYDFNGEGQLRPDSLCLIFRTVIKGLIKIMPSQYLLLNITAIELDLIANTFYDFYYSSTYGYGFATKEDFNSYCVTHPVVGSWLKYFSTKKQDSNSGMFQGAYEAGLENLPRDSKNVVNFKYSAGSALNASMTAVAAIESDFDSFYTPSVRAVNVHVEKYVPLPVEDAVLNPEVEVEVEVALDIQGMSMNQEEEVLGIGKEDGGEGEVKEGDAMENADGDEEEKDEDREDLIDPDADEEAEEEDAVEEDDGEEEEEEVEVPFVPIVKVKILKAPYPFDAEESKSKYVARFIKEQNNNNNLKNFHFVYV